MFMRSLAVLSFAALLVACSPEVGSQAWCEDLKEKDKGEWTLDETAEYGKSCIF